MGVGVEKWPFPLEVRLVKCQNQAKMDLQITDSKSVTKDVSNEADTAKTATIEANDGYEDGRRNGSGLWGEYQRKSTGWKRYRV